MSREHVVLVHGLWMNGTELGVLRRRLSRDHGFDVHLFRYRSLRGDAARVCAELADFAGRVAGGGRVHLVGHSLGGALVHRTLREHGPLPDGRVVLLGAPLNGCRAALGAARWPVLRSLLGPHVRGELMTGQQRLCDGPQAVGAIAGNRRLGTGQFVAHFREDNDGTVGVSETVIPGLSDHLVVRHSHLGMLLAADVARQVAGFLREGRFRR